METTDEIKSLLTKVLNDINAKNEIIKERTFVDDMEDEINKKITETTVGDNVI